MATLATVDNRGNALFFIGGTGVNDTDTVVQTDDISRYDSFLLQTTGGAVNVFVTLDGVNYSTSPLSLQDMGATSTNPVLLTAANRTYGFRGKFSHIRVKQTGATAATAVCLVCGNIGGA